VKFIMLVSVCEHVYVCIFMRELLALYLSRITQAPASAKASSSWWISSCEIHHACECV